MSYKILFNHLEKKVDDGGVPAFAGPMKSRPPVHGMTIVHVDNATLQDWRYAIHVTQGASLPQRLDVVHRHP